MNINEADELSLALFQGLLQAFFTFFKRHDLALEFLDFNALLGDQFIFRMKRLLPGFHLAPQAEEFVVFAVHRVVELLLNVPL